MHAENADFSFLNQRNLRFRLHLVQVEVPASKLIAGVIMFFYLTMTFVHSQATPKQVLFVYASSTSRTQ